MKSTFSISLIAASLLAVANTVSAADGSALFETSCVKCHGSDGKGNTKMGTKVGVKDLTDATVKAELTDDRIAKSIKEGIKEGDKVKMKGFPDLSDDDIKALVAHVRSLQK